MLRREAHGSLQGLPERPCGLPRYPIHQIEPDVFKPGTARRPKKRLRPVGGMQSPQRRQFRVGEALHPDAKPVDTDVTPAHKLFLVGGRRIDLRCDLGIGVDIKTVTERVNNALRLPRRQERGRAAADKDRTDTVRCKGSAVGAELTHQSIGITRTRIFIRIRERAKIAVQTLPTAKRDVDVDPDVRFHHPASAPP